MVVAGGTGDYLAQVEAGRIFAMNLRITSSVIGTRDEFARLLRLLVDSGVRPTIDRTIPLGDAREGFRAMLDGGLGGKVVLEPVTTRH